MDKFILDNMSGRELKEMIDNEVITLEGLDNEALGKIMNFEIDMLCLGTGDMEMIHRCSELMDERNEHRELDKEKFMNIIRETEKEHVVIVDDDTAKNKAKVTGRKHIAFRRIGLVAAVMAVLMSVTVVASAAFGVNIFEYIGKIVRQDEGSQIVVDDFTFYHNGEAKRYSSIEEMIEQEKLDIMYPTKWPEGIELDSVRIANGTNGNTIVQFYTNNSNTTVEIELYASEFSSSSDDKYVSNGIEYTLDSYDTFSASCYYNGNRYFIGANTRNELLTIIDNFEE